MRVPCLLLALTACGSEPDPEKDGVDATDTNASTDTGETSPTEPDEPAPYIVPDVGGTVADVDLAEVATVLQDTLASALTVTAIPVQTAYNAAMTGEDSRCPYYYATADGTYWYDACTSDAGTEFNGYAFAYSVQAAPDPYAPGGLMDYWQVFGAATVLDNAGGLMELGGVAYVSHTYGAGYETHTSVVQGTFQWDGPEAAGTWMDSDVDPDFAMYSYTVDNLQGALMFVDGGLGGLPGGWAVAFDENQILSASLGSSCGTEISGSIGVRTPEGVWVDVLFDGDTENPVPAAACDGCGEAYVQGTHVGQVCTDATVLLDWQGAPW
jgi:hypothetical protein